MTLSPELIEEVKKQIDVKSLYEECADCTANHILFEEFIEKTEWKGMLKLIFYIIMDETFPNSISKAPNGNLGYCLKLKPKA